MSVEEFFSISIYTKEYEIENVLIYEDGNIFILDELGYLQIKF